MVKNTKKNNEYYTEMFLCVIICLLLFYIIINKFSYYENTVDNNNNNTNNNNTNLLNNSLNIISNNNVENFENHARTVINKENIVPMRNPQIEVKPSPLLNFEERGLFTTKSLRKGDIIEVCPTLSMNKKELAKNNIINEHLFKGNKPNNSLLCLGYGSIINHSKKNQNCTWEIPEDDSYIIFVAIKDIKKGEELFSNYGDNYWKSRKYTEL